MSGTDKGTKGVGSVAVLSVPTASYPTIQSAVNAALPGDTVQVAAGTYAESVTIGSGKARLNIVGSGQRTAILQGAAGLVFGFDVSGSNQVSIAGFTVRGFAGSGVIVATDGNVVHRVRSDGNGAAGFAVSGAQNLLIHDEAGSNLTDGFDLTGSGNYLLSCVARSNRVHGVFVSGAANLLYHNCIEGSGADGVNLSARGSGSTLASNEICGSGASGIDAAQAPGNTIFSNACFDNGTTGPTPVGAGISVLTSLNIVDHNRVECSATSGILVGSAATAGAIRQNRLLDNMPDLTVLAPAGENVLDLNTCRTSVPAGLCTPPVSTCL